MKLFLIDGHALIFKMYYAFLGRPMVNSKGVDTSILFGFTKYLLELINREKPTHLAVSFDPPGGTFRNEMFPAYKANRGETPQLVIDALEPLTKICEAMEIPVLMIPGFEADDVIGSMAVRCAAEGFDVYMVTPDKDYGQLIDDHIFQYRPGKGGENEVIDIKAVCDKWGIDRPSQVIDILALCGDSADNVPGVQGIGPVGASKLLQKYGSVENIYSHIDELTPKQKEMFAAASDHIALSKELVTIKTDIPLEATAESMKLTASLSPGLVELFDLYEFNSLRRQIPDGPAKEVEPEVKRVEISTEEVDISSMKADKVAVNIEGETVYLAAGNIFARGSVNDCKSILENPGVEKYGYSMKSLMNTLAGYGVCLSGKLYDIELMHYLLNPERGHQLDILAKSYLGVDLSSDNESSATTGSLFDDSGESSRCETDRSLETVVMYHLGGRLYDELKSSDISGLYDSIEEPLLGVLSRMERNGVKVDVSSLRQYAEGLRREVADLEAEVRKLAAVPDLNVSSPKQIGEVIFEKLKLDPKAKKPAKGNWPTDEATLQELADRSPIIDAILEYRGLKKLLSTYIEPFPGYISEVDGRVHTTFNQALTSTGRLSSSNPNLQNIPIRTERGREIRKAFTAESGGGVMMSADYSQIELRIMAHLCGDEHMIEAFNAGTDVHAVTASKIFGIPLENVTAEQRRVAKTANFGIMYGISTFGLAQRLRCPRSEAKKIIEDYFESFPSIRIFIDKTLQSARKNGYVETLFSRRRYIPDINAHNAQLRALAERNAVNAPIQGTAADIIKIAMIRVDRRLREEKLKTRMVLQIHDELLMEVPGDEIDVVKNILISEMEGVMQLSVPLTVECNYGKTWLEAH